MDNEDSATPLPRSRRRAGSAPHFGATPTDGPTPESQLEPGASPEDVEAVAMAPAGARGLADTIVHSLI